MVASLVRRIVVSEKFQASAFAPLARKFYKNSTDAKWLVDSHASSRPHYSYCLYHAAVLAKRLGLTDISAIEFGVAGGNGLKFMVDFSELVKRATGVTIHCYGFDTGKGMPPPQGALDLPYWFQSGQYAMNQQALVPAGLLDKVILGDVADTVKTFLKDRKPAPIAAIFADMDYWSSTRDSFHMFADVKNNAQHFMPRIFMYYDDIIGTEVEMYGPYNGQLAAIEEFNKAHKNAKIHLNQNLLHKLHFRQRYQIYYAHFFDHPLYDKFVGHSDQEVMEQLLKFRNGR
jgi:hypothetical protein